MTPKKPQKKVVAKKALAPFRPAFEYLVLSSEYRQGEAVQYHAMLAKYEALSPFMRFFSPAPAEPKKYWLCTSAGWVHLNTAIAVLQTEGWDIAFVKDSECLIFKRPFKPTKK